MKKNQMFYIAVIAILLLGLWSCHNDDDIGDPQTAIIGKWKMIESGYDEDNMSPVDPDVYREYLPNGDVKGLSEAKQTTFQIDKGYLYYYYPEVTGCIIYKYSFINKNKLKLEFNSTERDIYIPDIFSHKIFIYERIK